MAHTDGPAYAPLTATVSLGTSAVFSFRPRHGYEDQFRFQEHEGEIGRYGGNGGRVPERDVPYRGVQQSCGRRGEDREGQREKEGEEEREKEREKEREREEKNPKVSLLLRPRSLVIFSGDAYSHCLHEISEVTSEKVVPLSSPSVSSSFSSETSSSSSSSSSVAIEGVAPIRIVNALSAGVGAEGEFVTRGQRLSLTFRHAF